MFQVIWTDEKIEALKACYPHNSNKNVAKQMGMSLYAIERQAGRLALRKSEVYHQRFNKLRTDSLLQASRRYTCNHTYFSVLDTREKAYWLGWLWADGYIRGYRGSFHIELSLQKSDECILQRFKSAIEAEYPIRYSRNAECLQTFSGME